MSINALLGTGLSALLANQAALRTTASNISNVNTPDYVRRVVGFKTQAPGGVLGGVDLGAVTRAVDLFLNAERLNASSGAGESDAADRFLDQLQKAMGGVAEGRDPASRLAAVTEGLAQLATDPASAAMQADFVQKLKSFAQGVADLGNRVQELRAQADGEIGTTIARVNTLTARIAELNVPIQHATLGGNSSSVLRDERDAAVRAGRRVRDRALGPGEVDQHVRARERGVDVRPDGDARRPADRSARVVSARSGARSIERRGEHEIGRAQHGRDERLAHAAAGAGDRDPCRRRHRTRRAASS